MGGSDGGDLVFGLATMAAVQYLSSSSPLMRLFCRSGEGKETAGGGGREKRGKQYQYLTHKAPTASAASMYRLQVNNSDHPVVIQKLNTFHQNLNNIRLAEARTFTSSKRLVPLFKSIQLHLF